MRACDIATFIYWVYCVGWEVADFSSVSSPADFATPLYKHSKSGGGLFARRFKNNNTKFAFLEVRVPLRKHPGYTPEALSGSHALHMNP